MEEYNDDKFFVFGGDDDEDLFPEDPPAWQGIVLFLGIILFAVILTLVIIYCSRFQEQRKRNKNKADAEKKLVKLRSNMVCKTWSVEPCLDASTTETTTVRLDSSDSTVSPSPSSSSSHAPEDSDHEERQNIANNAKCAVCCEEYKEGQPVYESNNPQCGHRAHTACIDKWLNLQNTCPECTQPFVLRRFY